MSTPKFEIHDSEWATKLEREFEDYMDELAMGVDADEDAETETGEAFCGCSTCGTRETIAWLIPRIAEGLKTGKITTL
jgi:hypothetical protein